MGPPPRSLAVAALLASVGGCATTRISSTELDARAGTVLCYFEPEEIASAAELKEGQRVRLDCTVDSFRVEGGQILSVLAGCDRDR
jgi:hypothetical protein